MKIKEFFKNYKHYYDIYVSIYDENNRLISEGIYGMVKNLMNLSKTMAMKNLKVGHMKIAEMVQ